MAKSVQKTLPTDRSVAALIDGVQDPARQADIRAAVALLGKVTGREPVAWGAMIGFGRYDYRYASGHSGTSPRIAVAPRKNATTFYLMPGFEELGEELGRLGKHATAKACLHVRRLSDVDVGVLEEVLAKSWAQMARLHPEPGADA
jgi:hypothetical protein